MSAVDIAIAFAKPFESCRLAAYPDSGGVWTIGWGHTGPEVRAGLIWTQAQADSQLVLDMTRASQQVTSLISVALSSQSRAALIDFCFNVGPGSERASPPIQGLSTSTLRSQVNRMDWLGAAREFPKWDHAGGVEERGLLRRRLAEGALFLSW